MSLLKRWFTTGIKEKDGPVLAGMLEVGEELEQGGIAVTLTSTPT